MNRFITIYILIMCVAYARGQDFREHWIAYPVVDDTSQVWFRQSYVSLGRPRQASISVASTGNFELYVNQKNVSTDVLIPYRSVNSDNVISVTYDVTRFLRAGTNTIVVWYSPAYAHENARQVAVCYYGRMDDWDYFAHHSDGNWLCRQANFSLSDNGSERVNGNTAPLRWNARSVDLACWQNAMPAGGSNTGAIKRLSSFYDGMKIGKIQQPTSINRYTLVRYDTLEVDSAQYEIREADRRDNVVCKFERPFFGNIRVTIRGAKKGERMNIGGLEYVCNGVTDEQAYGKFTAGYYWEVAISGDERFKGTQIQKVEGLEIIPYQHVSYTY